MPKTVYGLKNLLTLLTRLENRGLQNAGDEWWDEVLLNPAEPTSTVHHCQSPVLRSLDEAKRCMAALKEVQDHLGKRIRFLRKKCLPLILEDGIKALPDEILAQIFEAGYDVSLGWTFTRAVSQVSHHFRQVSLCTPLLWTRLSSHYFPDQVACFLSRSGHKGLEISTLHYDSNKKLRRFLQNLQPHSDRWTTLRHFDKKAEDTMRYIGCKDLPCMKSLHHHCNIYCPPSELPSLFYGISRVLSPRPIIHSRLTSFEFVADFRRDHFVDLSPLGNALNNMRNLKHLSVTLIGCSYNKTGRTKIRGLHSVPIDTLHVNITGRTSSPLLHSLYQHLSCLLPSIAHVTLADIRDIQTGERLFHLCTGDETKLIFPYGSVINITDLGVDYRFWTTTEVPLLTLLVKNCKIAHTINFEVRGMSFISRSIAEDDWKYFSALRHLRFTRCDSLTEWELTALVTNLIRSAEHGKGLQSLEVFDCRGISEECLLDLSDEVGSKLTWKL
ncbi:hypothetical protein BD410DRAFT_263447 [Rickenella mellea]|uniref:Uncharacterized protein n=1 Tax=Rickenella mellea TaxID=50990 RepID=A0A4Y7Q4F6_9AGAM|nr:hypothetical protein BD410DRAFT_263447 [Rickenella mellea]